MWKVIAHYPSSYECRIGFSRQRAKFPSVDPGHCQFAEQWCELGVGSSGVNWEWGNLGSLSRLESAGLGRVTFNTQCVSALCTLLTNQPVAVHIIGDVRSSAWSLSGQANS